MTILRTEEWTRESEGMISAVILNVFEGEVVHLADSLMVEFDLTLGDYPEGVEFESFYHAVPYFQFKDLLIESGMTYAGTT